MCLALPADAVSFLQLLIDAVVDPTLLLLSAAGGASLALTAGTPGHSAVDFVDGAAIIATVAVCTLVAAGTNYQKESKFRALNSLKDDTAVGDSGDL